MGAKPCILAWICCDSQRFTRWCHLSSEHSRPADRQYGHEPFSSGQIEAAVFPKHGVQDSSGSFWSTLPRWRGAQGATGTAPRQWLLLQNHRKSFVIAGPVLARSTGTMAAPIYLYATETDEFASVSSDTLSTHTHACRETVCAHHP